VGGHECKPGSVASSELELKCLQDARPGITKVTCRLVYFRNEKNGSDVDKKTIFALICASKWGTGRDARRYEASRLGTVCTERGCALWPLWCVCDLDRRGRCKTRGRGCEADALEYIDEVLRVVNSDIRPRGCIDDGSSSFQRGGKSIWGDRQKGRDEGVVEKLKHREGRIADTMVSWVAPALYIVRSRGPVRRTVIAYDRQLSRTGWTTVANRSACRNESDKSVGVSRIIGVKNRTCRYAGNGEPSRTLISKTAVSSLTALVFGTHL
jgi:hypothetical protein